MPNDADERELFRRLADDADRARLMAPEDLRARGDRRTAVRAAVGTVAVVVVVAGVLVGGNGLLGDAAPEPAPVDTPTPTVSPTPVPTEAATRLPTSIPEGAWLSAEDLRAEEQVLQTNGAADFPVPCGRPLLPPQGVANVSTRAGNYRAPGVPLDFVPDGTIAQTTMVVDRAEAAAHLIQEIQLRISRCPDDNHSEKSYGFADPGLPLSSARPDEHVLIDVSEPGLDLGDGNPNPARIHTYISVVQVRDTVTILQLRGWEASDTDIEDVRRLASAATVRLLDWRNATD